MLRLPKSQTIHSNRTKKRSEIKSHYVRVRLVVVAYVEDGIRSERIPSTSRQLPFIHLSLRPASDQTFHLHIRHIPTRFSPRIFPLFQPCHGWVALTFCRTCVSNSYGDNLITTTLFCRRNILLDYLLCIVNYYVCCIKIKNWKTK